MTTTGNDLSVIVVLMTSWVVKVILNISPKIIRQAYSVSYLTSMGRSSVANATLDSLKKRG